MTMLSRLSSLAFIVLTTGKKDKVSEFRIEIEKTVHRDPSCASSSKWSAWREVVAAAARKHSSLASVAEIALPAHETVFGDGKQEVKDCFLGSATFILLHAERAFYQGRLLGAVGHFSLLQDQYIGVFHPSFYMDTVWPLYDDQTRFLRDRLLSALREFQVKLLAEADKDFSAISSEMQAFMNWQSQLDQRHYRETDVHGLIPQWELSPVAVFLPPSQGYDYQAPSFRIYIYDEEGVPSLGAIAKHPEFCHYQHWSEDVGFHDYFRLSPLRTFDPTEADFFFVPGHAFCLSHYNLTGLAELNEAQISVVSELSYFNRSLGRDHIFAFHFLDYFQEWRTHIPNSIFLTPETEVGFEKAGHAGGMLDSSSPPFNSHKDVGVPPFMELKRVLQLRRHAKPISKRQHVAAFSGKLSRQYMATFDIRTRLVESLSGKPGIVTHTLDSDSDFGPESYEEMATMMGDARFCFVPRGMGAYTVRFFETLWAGCVPVLLSDHYEPPFATLFDVSSFVIKWPVSRIDQSLYDYLTALPISIVERYVAAAERVRCWYLYPTPTLSWIGLDHLRQDLEEVERTTCPNLSSSRNAYQAVGQLLARKVRATRVAVGPDTFYYPDSRTGEVVTDAGMPTRGRQ